MENKHTPGPWHVFDNRTDKSFDRYDVARIGVGSKLDSDVANCYGFASERTDEEVLANARLIAAAPDMLAALQEIVARNEIQHWFNLDQARAAIARATGVTS